MFKLFKTVKQWFQSQPSRLEQMQALRPQPPVEAPPFDPDAIAVALRQNIPSTLPQNPRPVFKPDQIAYLLVLTRTWGNAKVEFAQATKKHKDHIAHADVQQALTRMRAGERAFLLYLNNFRRVQGQVDGLDSRQIAVIRSLAKAWVDWKLKQLDHASYGSCNFVLHTSWQALEQYLFCVQPTPTYAH